MLPTLSEHPSSSQLNQSTLVTQAQPEVIWGSPVRRALVENWLLDGNGKYLQLVKYLSILTFIRWGITVALVKYWSHISVTVQNYKQTLSNLNMCQNMPGNTDTMKADILHLKNHDGYSKSLCHLTRLFFLSLLLSVSSPDYLIRSPHENSEQQEIMTLQHFSASLVSDEGFRTSLSYQSREAAAFTSINDLCLPYCSRKR